MIDSLVEMTLHYRQKLKTFIFKYLTHSVRLEVKDTDWAIFEGQRWPTDILNSVKPDIFCLSAASNRYLTGTRIVITGVSTYHCRYNPPLVQANISSKQVSWMQSWSCLMGDCLQSMNLKWWANWRLCEVEKIELNSVVVVF